MVCFSGRGVGGKLAYTYTEITYVLVSQDACCLVDGVEGLRGCDGAGGWGGGGPGVRDPRRPGPRLQDAALQTKLNLTTQSISGLAILIPTYVISSDRFNWLYNENSP